MAKLKRNEKECGFRQILKKHDIEVVIDRLLINESAERLEETGRNGCILVCCVMVIDVMTKPRAILVAN
jgi:excinuclease UvrABC ATPase subunit